MEGGRVPLVDPSFVKYRPNWSSRWDPFRQRLQGRRVPVGFFYLLRGEVVFYHRPVSNEINTYPARLRSDDFPNQPAPRLGLICPDRDHRENLAHIIFSSIGSGLGRSGPKTKHSLECMEIQLLTAHLIVGHRG